MATGSAEKVLEQYVNLMEKNINSDIDPKENFIKFACGNFNLESYDQKHGEYPPNRYGDPFDRILENEALNFPSIVKARNFYKSYENDVGNILRSEGINEFCGGFPALNENWSETNFDWIKAAAILSAMNLHTVIGYSIKYLDEKRIIQISIEIPDEDVITSAEEMLGKLGISGEKISEIIGDVNMVKEKSQSQAPKTDDKELRKLLFDRFFEIATGVPPAEEDSFEFDEYDASYVKGLLNIFAEVQPKTVANYIMCLAIYKHGESKIFPIPHELSTNYFAPAIVAAGLSEYWSPTEAANREEIRRRYLSSFETCKDKFQVDDIKSTTAFMVQDNVVSEYIAANFPQEDIDKEYDSLEINPTNFFQNILNITKHGSTASVKKYFSDKTEDQEMQYQIISFLQDIVNTGKKPMIFHFSGWEVEMWRELFECFKLENESAEDRILMDAITMQMITFNIPEDSKIVKRCAATTEALKLAFEDYKSWLSDNGNLAEKQARNLKKLNLNNHQAFFVSFAQHFCGVEHVSTDVALLTLSNSDEFAQEFGISRTI